MEVCAVVEPPEVLGVDASVLFAKLGGATGAHLSFVCGVPLARLLSHTAPVYLNLILKDWEYPKRGGPLPGANAIPRRSLRINQRSDSPKVSI